MADNHVPSLPSQDEVELNIKLNILTWMIDLFGIDVFCILNENEELSMTTFVESIMCKYSGLKYIDKPIGIGKSAHVA